MATFAFSGGVVALPAYGERQKVRFVGTWANGDTWSMSCVGSLAGDFTLGKGNIAGQVFSGGFVFKDRVFVGFSDNFALSSNGDATLWEEQNSGAAVINFNSQYGSQDTVQAFATIQGRLGVFGTRSIQVWDTNADPANFALSQSLDNSGTVAGLSVQGLGDSDVLYLDYTGIRSLRTKALTLNAEVSDIGTPIDEFVKASYAANQSNVCSVIEPLTKQYWLCVNNQLYVLSKFSVSQITAWSIFNPTIQNPLIRFSGALYDQDGIQGYLLVTGLTIGKTYYWIKGANDTNISGSWGSLSASGSFVATEITAEIRGPTFGVLITCALREIPTGTVTPMGTFYPIKMVVHNGLVHLLDSYGQLVRYGLARTISGSPTQFETDYFLYEPSGPYDKVQPLVELPWNAMSNPSMTKQATGIDLASSGKWSVYASMDPQSAELPLIATIGNVSATPNMDTDGSFDIGHIPYHANGTHVKFKFIGDPAQAIPYKYKLGSFTFNYNDSNNK